MNLAWAVVNAVCTCDMFTCSGGLLDESCQCASVVSTTNQVEYIDTVLLPVAQYQIIANNLVSTAGTKTILQHILDANPYIKEIAQWYPLSTAGANSTTRMMCYRKDPEAVQLIVPQEFEMLPPQERALAFVVNCHARTGGVVFRYPLSAVYADGI